MIVDRAKRGFTLLEVLVALIIFGIAFGAIASIFQTALRHSAAASTLLDAQAVAEQQMARLGTELPLLPGEHAGVETRSDREPLTWRSRIELAAPIPDGEDIALYQITIDVARKDRAPSLFTLETVKIGVPP